MKATDWSIKCQEDVARFRYWSVEWRGRGDEEEGGELTWFGRVPSPGLRAGWCRGRVGGTAGRENTLFGVSHIEILRRSSIP